MPHTLHIFISDDTGDTILAIKEPIRVKTPSKTLQNLIVEKYPISRIIDQARVISDIRDKMNK